MVSAIPPDYADIRLITGEQGGGKSTTSVALPIGVYHDNLTGLRFTSGEVVKALPLTQADKALLQKAKLSSPYKLRYARVVSPDGAETKLVKIPPECMRLSATRIFANFTLYGVEYVPIHAADIIEYMNTDLFQDAWILLDESVDTDSRNSMDSVGKLMAIFGATIRKRCAHLLLSLQYKRMIEHRFRLFATTTIICSYDEITQYITVDIKRRSEPAFSTSYWQPTYRPFFDTHEIVKAPQYKIDNALAKINKQRALVG